MLSVSSQCVVAQARSALLESSPCVLYSVSWRPRSVSFGLWIILFILLPPSLPPFIFPPINQCVRCLVPLACGLMAGRYRFTRAQPIPGVQIVEFGDRTVESELNRTRRKGGEKNEGRVGRVPSLFPLQSLPFFFLVNFSTALYYLNAQNRLTRGWLGGSPWTNQAPTSTKRRSC